MRVTRQHFSNTNLLLMLAALLLIGFALRLIHLNTPLWGDEVATWAFARRTPFDEMLQFSLHDPTPPLYYVLIHFTLPLFGASFVGLRWLSVLFGLLAIPIVYWSLRQAHFSAKDALCAVLLVAVSSMLIYYAQEARVYTLLAFLALLSMALLWRCLQKPNLFNSLLLSASMLLLAFTHRSALFLIVAQIAFLLLNRAWRPFLLAGITFALIALSIFLQISSGTFPFGQAGALTDTAAIRSLIETLTAGSVGMQHVRGLPGGLGLAFPHPLINQLLPLVGILVLVVVLIIGAGKIVRRNHANSSRQYILMLWFCILIPVGLALLAGSSLSPRPQWLLRGLIYIWPLYFMAVVTTTSQHKFQPYLIIILVLLNGFSLYPYYTRHTRFDNAAAFEQLSLRAGENDLIVADPWYMFEVVNYYYKGQAPTAGFHQEQGWVDTIMMSATNQTGLFLLDGKPVPGGEIYVYHRSADLVWANQFPDTDIFVYNGRVNGWQLYQRSP